MSDVTLITPAQERLLSSALVSAIKNANSGMSPNESLAKAANDNGLTPEFACRMTEAYNASKTVKYLQDNKGEKRADNFDLADRDHVLKLMYAVPEKTANFPTPVVSPTVPKPALEKAASVKPVVKALYETRLSKLSGLRSQLKQAGEEIRMELRHAKDQVVKSACALESALRIPGHESFEEIEKRVVSTYGPLGKKAMDIVWAMTDFERHGEKRASEQSRRLVMGVGPAYDCAREMMAWLEKAGRLNQQMHDYETAAKKVNNTMPEASGQQPGGSGTTFVSDPGMPRRPATATLVDVEAEIKGNGPKDAPEKTAGDDKDKGTVIGYDPTSIMNTLTKKPEESASPFSDPQHEAKLRSIRAKLVVNDMISNDSVLSAYPPEHVFNAYNEISRIAPGVSAEPLLMRSLVGRSLQTGGRLEANEIKQLLDAESTHRNIRVRGY